MEIRKAQLFTAGSLSAANSFGGKTDGLLFLRRNGFRVPEFFLLSFQQLQELSVDPNEKAEQLRAYTETLPGDTLWAVRSSAGVEDGRSKSFAGLFHTELNVSKAALPEAISKVFDGFEKAQAHDYHKSEDVSFHILLQQMLAPQFSGVAFSRHPLEPSKKTVFANLVPGLGITLVSGEETAMSVEITNGKTTFHATEETYSGKYFAAEYGDVTIAAKEFQKQVQPFLRELEDGVRKLSRLKGYDVDVEFAVADGKLWWLQVRPVTTMASTENVVTWDNASIGENYPGLTLPLTISLAKQAYGTSYAAMGLFLGAGKKFVSRNEQLLYNMVGGIHGAMYYNVTAWQQLLYQAPFGKKTSRLITRMWGADEATFTPPQHRASPAAYVRLLFNFINAFLFFGKLRRRYIEAFPKLVTDYSDGRLNGKSQAELLALYHEADRKFKANWTAPMLNGLFTMIVFSSLKKIVSRSRLQDSHPNFVNDILFSRGDVISVAIVRELQQLLSAIRRDETAKQLFEMYEPAMILQRLEMQLPMIFQQVKNYISKYGERGEEGELRIEAVNYKEDPLRFIAMLKANLETAETTKEQQPFDYRAVLRQAYRFRPLRRWFLYTLVELTIKRVRDRENFRFMRTQFFSMIRWIFRAIDHDLLRNGYIEQANDSLYLEADDIMDPSRAPQYKPIIRERKAQYAAFANEEHFPRYLQSGDQFLPVEKSAAASANGLKGTGCCSGIVTGTVRIIDASDIHDASLANHILVARNFEPGWINLFGKAAGLIAERGSLLSHTAILCRELGIPSIVGAAGITRRLKNGDTIRMNGASGKIELLS